MDLATRTAADAPVLHFSNAEQVIRAGDSLLEATLHVPEGSRGLVLIPLASSAGRFASDHVFVAEVLQQAGLSTLLVDLLSPAEEAAQRANCCREALVVERVLAVVDWLAAEALTCALPLGLLATGSNAVALLEAAAQRPERITAVAVQSREPDLGRALSTLSARSLRLSEDASLERAAEQASELFVVELCEKPR